MSFDANRGVHISTGPGIVAHLPGLTAYAEGDAVELNTLVARLNALAGESWTEVVRTLTTQITALGYEAHPKLACVSVESDRVAAFVFGETALSLVIDGAETVLDGSESSTWIDVTLHGTVGSVMAGTQSDSPIVGVLRDGVVPGGGFMLDTAGPMPASGRWVEEMRQSETDEVVEIPQPEVEAEADAAPAAESTFAAPIVGPGPETAAPVEDVPAEPAEEPALEAEPVAEEAVAPEADEAPVETTLEADEPLEDIPTEPVAEEPALEAEPVAEETVAPESDETPVEPILEADEPIEDIPAEPVAEEFELEAEPLTAAEPVLEAAPEYEVDEPEAEMSMPDMSAAAGIAAGASSVAAAGLFTRLDQRIEAVDEGLEAELPVEHADPELDPNASVFDRPDLIDAQEDAGDEHSYDDIADAPQALANPNEVDPSQPAEPSPIASLTQTRPQISGVRCLAGHLTKPDGSPCITCGARIDPDVDEEMGDRPALGTLTFDDGAKLSIERPAAIGSDVPSGYAVAGEPATIIRLDDGEGGVHPIHMEMRLSGWDVEITDMGSDGGTYTTTNDDRQTRTKLRSGQSVILEPGMSVEAGRRSFTYTVGPTPPTI